MTTADAARLARALTGRYTLEREVGRGGMATVYLAHDDKHDRDVAVKVLLSELAATLSAERFLREIRLVARLQHPHILPLFDSGEVDGLRYFVMPFVDGESLRTRLDREGALGLEDASRIVRQVADALDYAHARGVVHRDLKPENVLLTGDAALLADFGIARSGESPASPETLTSVGTTLGTPAYMSPEQAAGERELDGRSDVYSLGCVCYEVLAGRPPFVADNAMGLISQHIVSPPPPLTGALAPLPRDVADAVSRALAKDPAARFTTAGELASALEGAVAAARHPTNAELQLRDAEQRRAGRRVLVLDFANLSHAADVDWLSTGIVETVSADLAKIDGVKVLAQEAAARRQVENSLRGRAVDAALALNVGRAAGADWVVWGAFQKVGPRIRITPHFVDTAEGTTLGGEKIDGMMDDIFALQDRIVTALADALRIRLTSGEVERIALPETRHLAAYEHFARGYGDYLAFGKESVKAAEEHFRSAIAIDPDYALAHAGLGYIHGPTYIATGRREVLDEGVRLLERALALDPSIGEAYAWLAYLQFRQGRFREAEQSAGSGVRHDPSAKLAWYMLGCTHLCRGVVAREPPTLSRAVPPLLRALALDPAHLPAYMALAGAYLLRGQHSHARLPVDRALELERRGGGLAFLGARVQRAVLHLGAGELEAALPLLDEAVTAYTSSDHVYAETMNAYAHCVRGTLHERLGRDDAALDDFTRACEIADSNEHRIAIGAHWVKGRVGLARVLHRTARRKEAERALAEGRELFASRARFVWTWIHGATDADVLYEVAATLATLGRSDDALDTLREAAGAGWADVPTLRHDPAFAELRDAAETIRLCSEATSLVTLAPPVGSGGLG